MVPLHRFGRRLVVLAGIVAVTASGGLPNAAAQPPGSAIEAIEIAYPERSGWATGSGHWLAYWFVVSMVVALLARPLLKVNL